MNKLLESECILPDDYPIYLGYIYIADNVLVRSEIEGNVLRLKLALNAKEIRRCELFDRDRKNMRLGDSLE